MAQPLDRIHRVRQAGMPLCVSYAEHAVKTLASSRCAVMWDCLQNFDGSGGNGAAQRHFEATGSKYPLAVKLGTITPRGADVYSYGEDEMVTDPHLVRRVELLPYF